MFSVNFKDIAAKIVPFQLRKVKILESLTAVLKPLQSLNMSLSNFTSKTGYELKFTGQIIYLEHILNDTFDNVTRGISIVDTANIDLTYWHNRNELIPPYYLYNRSESKPPKYIKNRVEYINVTHFIIKIPAAVSFNEPQLKAIVERYLQAGKNYIIEII